MVSLRKLVRNNIGGQTIIVHAGSGRLARLNRAMRLGLNVNGPVVRMMARAHVYADRARLNEARMGEKLAVTRAKGARHASACFGAGLLDPVQLARRLRDPILIIYGAGTNSKAEMEGLASLPNMESIVLPAGKLAIHERFPDALADAVTAFLAERAA